MTMPLALRRAAVIAGVALVVIIGAASVRAAGMWTAQAAPLTVAPTTVSELEAKLAQEHARSDALEQDLAALGGQVVDLRSAIDAASTQLDTDATTAGGLQDRMKAAQDRLAKLDALVAKAERQLASTLAAARARPATTAGSAAAAPAATPTGEPWEHDDD
jgi:septal ring factor EnvC (AmiA/AmiB activator)